MEANRVFEENETETSLDTELISYNKFKNGFLKEWMENQFEDKIDYNLFRNPKDLIGFIFMALIAIRVISLLIIGELDDRFLLYFGGPWHHLGGNRTHIEILFLLWAINFILFYLFIRSSPCEHYEWLEVFAILGGIVSPEEIGIFSIKYLY